ncbi:hypothetical protein JXA32_00110 [Candidatus Sumerlaeota bacterium]|nr:hypothetical protein [Candidatus Sumerlaeota bacterium]
MIAPTINNLARSAPAVLLIAAALVACSAYPQVFRLTEERYASRPPEYPIALTEDTFQEPFQKIAMIRTHVYEDWAVEEAGRAELKRQARKLGGDGVIQMRKATVLYEKVSYTPNAPSRVGAIPAGKFYLEGIVVRFDRAQPRLAVDVGVEHSADQTEDSAPDNSITEKQP